MRPKIKHPKGDTFRANVVVNGPTGRVDLTGATVEWKLAGDDAPGSAILITKVSGNGIIITDADQGEFSILLSASETGALAAGEYFHQARVTLQSGEVHTVFGDWLSITETLS